MAADEGRAPAEGLAFADTVIERCRRVLGRRMVAAYVVGSLASGDATPPGSDIDIMTLTGEGLEERTRAAVHETTSPNAVLNACRGWHWSLTSQWVSKSHAGRWAGGRLPDGRLVEDALVMRAGGGAGMLPAEEVAAFLTAIEAAVSASTSA